MSHLTAPADQAAALVADPCLYEVFAGDYSDDLSFYSALRANAQKSLTFDQYVELRRVFLDRGPTEAVRDRLEERLDRSLKNMALGMSPRGRAYAVSTLEALNQRRQAFGRLDIAVPSLLSVTQTTIEYLYDEAETPTECRETLAQLLSAVPADEREAVEYVARAWLSEEVLTADTPTARLEQILSTYLDTVSKPEPPIEGESVAEYREAAATRPFADPEKRRLREVILHASPSVASFRDYLYLTATNAIEGYRHGAQDVSRADLLIARRHLQLLDSVIPFPDDSDRASYVASYRHLANAIEAGGGRWLTDRAGVPQPQWQTVVDEYSRAAATVRAVSAERYIKYLSKAFRHAAHATDDWATRHQLHINACQLFNRLEPPTLAANDGASPAAIESTIEGTIHTHRCREYEARARLSFAEAAYDEVFSAAKQARSEAAAAPQQSLQLRELDTIEAISAARTAERHGEFNTALSRYDDVNTDADELQVGLTCHRQLCRVKRLLKEGHHETALAKAHEWFESESTIVLAVEASCGLLPELDGGSPTVSDQFLTIDTAALSGLTPLIQLTTVGGAASEAVREQIADCLLSV